MSVADEGVSGYSSKESSRDNFGQSCDFPQSQSLFCISKSDEFWPGDVPRFTRNVIVCILSECVNELAILRNINLQNDLGLNPDRLTPYVSIQERYMGQENHADYRINSTDNNFDKLAKDINMLYVAFKDTCKEIRKYGKYRSLEETIKNVHQMYMEEEQLLEDEANQEKVIEDLKNRCEEERLDNIGTIEDTNSKIQGLKFQVEDIYIYGQQEVQYFDKWEKSRVEQNLTRCREKEHLYEKIIKDTNDKIIKENRCHNEVASYFQLTKNDYLEEIQYWMKKYDEEIDQREGDTINLKTELEKIVEERRIMLEKYEKRQAEINDWLEYKRIKEVKEKQRIKEINAAIRIQSWWRGVMVRKKLGPYKEKKKGKGKNKDKKKEKKK